MVQAILRTIKGHIYTCAHNETTRYCGDSNQSVFKLIDFRVAIFVATGQL
jgi:hypothetical protein